MYKGKLKSSTLSDLHDIMKIVLKSIHREREILWQKTQNRVDSVRISGFAEPFPHYFYT